MGSIIIFKPEPARSRFQNTQTMKIKIEHVQATTQVENIEIINRCNQILEGITRLEEAFSSIQGILEPVMSFDCGKGGSHIWVSNWKNERLILITE